MLLRLKLLLILSFAFSFTYAQNKVSGKVSNEKNEPLPGVSVRVAGQAGGTSTNVEGRYTLTLPTGKYELEFSAVGYETKL
jgi:hypothetical protein